MAARLNKMHQDSVKSRIKASNLITRLAKHAAGEVEMSSTQVDAAKYLLSLVVSKAPVEVNQKSEVKADVSATVNVAPALTVEQWMATFGGK